MKKKLVTLISFVVALILSVGIFSGCNLVTSNTERDMNQVVAEIKIEGYEGQTEEIYKKDIMIGYMNYGYYYVQSGNSTASQMFDTIMNNLINNRIIVQTAKKELKKANGTLSDGKWEASDIITDDSDIVDAKYNSILALDNLIKQYIETEQKHQDSSDEKERAVPTGATNAVEELTTEGKETYIAKMIKDGEPTVAFKGEIGSDRLVAYNKVLKLLEVNQVLDKDNMYKTGNMFTTYYYNYLLEGNFESILVEKFEKQLLASKDFNNLTYDALKEVFTKLYNSQKELYENDEEAYKTALSSATKVAPIIYAKEEYKNNYGFVWNLLIGASEEQQAKINELDTKNQTVEWFNDERAKILENTSGEFDSAVVLVDQRSSWVTAGYDSIFVPSPATDDADNIGTVKFINDYTFLGENGIPFQGVVEWMNKGDYTQDATNKDANGNIIVKYLDKDGNVDENYKPEYRVVSVNKVEVNASNLDDQLEATFPTSLPITEDLIKELIYAFSTDPGSLSSVNGYLIKKGDDKSQFVKEFQTYGEKLLTNKGNGVVTTNFGYHSMFYNTMANDYQDLSDYCEAVDSKIMDKACDKVDATAEEYFNYLFNNWLDLTKQDKDTYLYSLAKTYMDSLISDYEADLQRKTKNGVVKYESRYADLLG